MSYRVEKKEKLSDGIRRIAAEEISATIAELHSVPLDAENIHEARRHLKKLRAILRLFRKQFPSASFKRENQTFRAAGKMLAPIRDARVIGKALASLKSSAGKSKPGFRFLTNALQKDCDRRETRKAEITKITKLLQMAHGRIKNWPLIKLGDNEVRAALERSFRRCRKAFRESIKTKENEAFHDWRKRIKDLEYHLCLFETAWRKKTKRAWKEIKRLDDFLGEDHDMVLLSEKLRNLAERGSVVPDQPQRAEKPSASNLSKPLRLIEDDTAALHETLPKLVKAISKRRTKLQQRAIKIGKNLFKEQPKVFIRQKVRL